MTAAIPSRVQFRSVTKRFGAKDVLLSCNLDITPGRFTALFGTSGCGKTTIIDLVAGYEFPSEGEVLLDGQRIKDQVGTASLCSRKPRSFHGSRPWATSCLDR